MNNIRFGYDVSEKWRVSVTITWGDGGQTSVGADLIEQHDYNESE